MSNIAIGTLEALLVMRDQMTPALASVAKGASGATSTMKSAEAAAKSLDSAMGNSSNRASKFADTLGRTSTTLARSASAFGLPVGPLRALDDVADVAELGLKGLSKSALTASVSIKTFQLSLLGPIAAAAAVGAAIGTLLDKFGLVPKVVDEAIVALGRMTGLVGPIDDRALANVNQAAFQREIGLKNAEAQKKQVESLREMGVATKDIAEMYKGVMTPELQKQLGLTKEAVKAETDRAAAAKRSAEQFKELTDQLSGRKAQEEADLLLRAFTKEGGAEGIANIEAFRKKLEDLQEQGAKITDEGLLALLAGGKIDDLSDIDLSGLELGEDTVNQLERAGDAAAQLAEQTKKLVPPPLDDYQKWAGVLGGIAELFGFLGGAGDNAFSRIGIAADKAARALMAIRQAGGLGTTGGKMAAGIGALDVASGLFGPDSKTGAALGGAARGAATGAMFGPWGAVIGGVAGGIMGFINKGKQLKKELESMRQSFIQNAGGLEALRAKAKDAGISLDALFKAKDKNALGRAIDEISGKLETWDEAHAALQDAVDRYGFSIEELGPKFKQQELDAMGGQLLQDFKLLTASGIDTGVVLTKMSENLSEYVQTAVRAGTTVPEAMRPMIEAAIQNGTLLDENGEAYASAEAAGITFAQTMSEQFSSLIEKIDQLVSELTGIPNIDRTINVNTNYTGGGPPSMDPGFWEGSGGDNPNIPDDYRAASGFHAMVTRPTRILVGEAGPERVDVTPQGPGGAGGGVGAGGLTVNAAFNVDPTQTGEGQVRLNRINFEQLVHELRNSPLVRQSVKRGGRAS